MKKHNERNAGRKSFYKVPMEKAQIGLTKAHIRKALRVAKANGQKGRGAGIRAMIDAFEEE